MKKIIVFIFVGILFLTNCSSIDKTQKEWEVRDKERQCTQDRYIVSIYLDAVEIALRNNDYCKAYEYMCMSLYWIRKTEDSCEIEKDENLIGKYEEWKNLIYQECSIKGNK